VAAPDRSSVATAPDGGRPRYVGVVIDLDGVCYREDDPIPGSREAVAKLRAAGVGVVFATNNATRTPQETAQKLRALDFEADDDEIVTAAVAAADMIAPGTRCLVIGMEGLREAVRSRGCELVDDPAVAEVVVTGLDKELTYDKLVTGTRALLAGARFIASNADHSFPAADGISPGAGVVVAALETATRRTAEVAGKPNAALYRAAASKLPDGDVLMIGDKLETDIAGAAALGWDTALVLTGVSERSEVDDANPAPTWVADDLAGLVTQLLGDT
jgi:HAD superfamily hydrolase (TIGR01450 family)